MTKFYLLTLACFGLVINASASDLNIDINGDGANDHLSVYYNLETKESISMENTEWDLGFSSFDPRYAAIYTNMKYNVYVVPGSNFDTFGSEIDTTGISGWERGVNSKDSWDTGSLNLGKRGFIDNIADYGWGEYNMQTHNVVGNKVFIITDHNRETYQVAIDGLYNGEFVVLWADLDGSNEQELSVANDASANTVMKMVNLETQEITQMPSTDSWDIIFEKYQLYFEEMNMTRGVSGIRTAPHIRVAQVTSDNPLTEKAPEFPSEVWSSSITEIGHDWKTVVNYFPVVYEIDEDVVYFVQRVDETENPIGDPYRLVPVSYGSNVFVFSTDVNGSVFSNIPSVNVYPNVVSAGESITLPEGNFGAKVTIYDATGNIVSVQEQNNVNTNNLVPGNYFMVIDGAELNSSRFVVK
jgi:hypothetical protein